VYRRFDAKGGEKRRLPETVRLATVLDTGAPYFICNPEVAAQVKLAGHIGPETLDTRRGRVRGDLFRGTLRFLAQEGDSLDLDATVFVLRIAKYGEGFPRSSAFLTAWTGFASRWMPPPNRFTSESPD
jgi:hypothetical protein